MDLIAGLGDGFAALADPFILLALLAGVFVGSVVGVLPGIGPVGAMAILLPLTFTMDPAAGIIMTTGIFLGSQYGGSTTAVLVGVPGEASSVVTTIDGYPMAKKGRAGAALAVSAIGSFVAGTMAVLLLMVLAGPLSDVAAEFSAPEYLLIALFALVALSRLTGGSGLLTIVGVGVGLLLATIGLDSNTGNARFTFGITAFLDGIEITPVAVGMFGVAEILRRAERHEHAMRLPKVPFQSLWPTRTELRRSGGPMARGGLIGFFFGMIPGPSAVVSTYASYAVEKRISKHKNEFGSGAIEGVAGPEAANNGAAGGAMVPLIVLGLPFSGVTALLLAGFTIHGVTPGPLFMRDEPALFWTLIAGLYAANLALLVLNLPMVSLFTALLRIPRDLLMSFVLVIAVIGTYATRGAVVDVFWLLVMSVLGYVFVKVGISRVAVILAFVIAPMLESAFVQTVSLAQGDPLYLFTRPIAIGIMAVIVVVVVAPAILRRFTRRTAVAEALDLQSDDA